jgi:hypothetical protein
MIFVAASTRADVDVIATLKERIKSDGAIWMVYAKGSASLTERDVFTAGRTQQLTDQKPLKISETLTAVRFVIPAALRKKR